MKLCSILVLRLLVNTQDIPPYVIGRIKIVFQQSKHPHKKDRTNFNTLRIADVVLSLFIILTSVKKKLILLNLKVIDNIK